MRRTTVVASGVLLLIAGGIAVAAAESVGPFAGKPGASVATSVDPNTAQFHPSAAQAESALQDYLAKTPDTNNGVYGDDPAKAIAVHLVAGVKPDAGLLAAVKPVEAAGVTVTYDTVLRSKADLDKTLAEVCGKPGVSSCYANPQTDQVEITVRSGDLASVQAFVDPSVKITVDDSPLPALAQRYNDTLPVLGSDYVSLFNGVFYNHCSLGFEVHASTGSNYGLSAGHCSASINQSFGMPWYTSGPSGCCYKFIGNYSFTRYCNGSGCYDGELIYNTASPNFTPYIWIGGGNSSVARHVTGAFNALINANVYNDGAVTGQTAIQKVKQGPYCQLFAGGFTTCGIYKTQSTTTDPACQAGDSGGPVFAPDGPGTGVVAIGIVTGFESSMTVCYYTSVPTLLSSFGMTIST